MMMVGFFYAIIVVVGLMITATQGQLYLTSTPSELYVGGMFRTFDYNYDDASQSFSVDRNDEGALHLAAFMMAVDQINNKTDGVFDTVLLNTTLKVSVDVNQRSTVSYNTNYDFDGALAAYFSVGYGGLVAGVVNALPDESVLTATGIVNAWSIPTVASYSTLSDLSHSANYPYNTRIIPSDSFAAAMVYKTIQQYSWNKIALLYASNTLGLDAFTTFEYESRDDKKLEYLYQNSFPTSQKNLKSFAKDIMDTGATIIVLLMDDSCTARFLVQAYEIGLLTNDIQVIGISLSSTIQAVYDEGATTSTISDIMRGYLVVAPYPNLYFQRSLGKQFLQSFRSLPPTKTVDSSGTVHCSSRTDDTFATDNSLYQLVPSNPSESTTCLGIESFSSFAADGSDLDPSIMYSYTSAMVFAYIMDFIMSYGINPMYDDVIYTALTNFTIDGQSHESVVGDISFFQGIATNDYFGRGDRFEGNMYKLLNFNQDVFEASGLDSTMAMAITTVISDTNSEFLSCEDLSDAGFTVDCYDAVYRDGSSNIPSDSKENLYETLNLNASGSFIAFGVIGIVCVFATTAFYVYYRETKTMINAQFKVILVISFAALLGSIRILLAGMTVTLNVCIAELWFEHLAFRLMFGTIMLKLWRIDKLINMAGIQRIKITENDLLKYISYHVLGLFVALAIVTGTGVVNVGHVKSIYENQATYQPYCNVSTDSGFGGIVLFALYLSEVGYIIMGLYYLYRTRAVPPMINETKVLAPAMIGSVIVVVALIVSVFVMNLDPVDSEIAVAVGFILVMLPGTIAYAAHKYMMLLQEWDKEKKKAAAAQARLAESQLKSPKKNTTTAAVSCTAQTDEELFQAASETVRKMKCPYEKSKFIQRNIDAWKTLLLKIEEDEDSQSSSKKNSVAPVEIQVAMASNLAEAPPAAESIV